MKTMLGTTKWKNIYKNSTNIRFHMTPNDLPQNEPEICFSKSFQILLSCSLFDP